MRTMPSSLLTPTAADAVNVLSALPDGFSVHSAASILGIDEYDAEDLDELPQEHRSALAETIGWSGDTKSMVKAGEKVYRMYRKNRGGSQVALLLPSLLKPLARAAFES